MLRHTFCHLPGVAEKTERRLWDAGVASWGQALERPAGRLDPEGLRTSEENLAAGNLRWFQERLTAAQAWRLFPGARAGCAFLDIETTGMGPDHHVTTVALYDGASLRTYVHGENLDDFPRDFARYGLLVTFNGKCFDVPFLERHFRRRFAAAHIDLRYVLRGLGYRGGLKNCERALGLVRPPGLEEVDGNTAVALWHEYRRTRDRRALETLLAYNVQDTVNLEVLLVTACNSWLDGMAAYPWAAPWRLPAAAGAGNPFTADADLVRGLLQRYPWLAHSVGAPPRLRSAPGRTGR